MKRVLDDLFVKGLKPKDGKQHEVHDAASPGLSIRVSGTGNKKSWSLTYKPPGSRRNHRHPLGTYPLVSLKDARIAASDAKGEIAAGRQPKRPKDEDIPETVAELVDKRLDLAVKGRLIEKTQKIEPMRSADEIERRYRKIIIPKVGNVRIDQFDVGDLNKVVDPLFKAKKYRAAGMAHTDLQALFNFAEGRGYLPHNPIRRAARIGSLGEDRKRYLSKVEIPTFWQGISAAMPQADHTPTILKLILVTLQRPDEVCGMRRTELDMDQKIWTIPGERTKNAETQELPLTALAITLIEEAMEESEGDILFPNRGGRKRKAGERHLLRNAVGRALNRALTPKKDKPLGRLGIAKFNPHDLRRTGSTHMDLRASGLNVPRVYIDYVLNHITETKKSVTARHYTPNPHLDEKRESLEKWDTFLTGLIGVQQQRKKPKQKKKAKAG